MTVLTQNDRDLLAALMKRGYLGSTIEPTLIRYMQTWSCDLFSAISETHILNEVKLADSIAEVFQLQRLSRLSHMGFPANIQEILPFSFAYENNCIPVIKADDDEKIFIVHHFPVDEKFQKSLEQLRPGAAKNLCVGEYREIRNAILSNYPLTLQMPNLFR